VALLERYLTRPPTCMYRRDIQAGDSKRQPSVPRGTCRVLWCKGKVCACKEGEVHHRQVELTLAAGNAVPNSSLFGKSRAVPTLYECKKGKGKGSRSNIVGYKLVLLQRFLWKHVTGRRASHSCLGERRLPQILSGIHMLSLNSQHLDLTTPSFNPFMPSELLVHDTKVSTVQ
jgi:hypothetical protein